MMSSFKHFLALGACSLLSLSAAAQVQPAKAEMSPKERAEIEAQLVRARQQLEAAARQVGELSGKLTGPVGYDYLIANRMGPRRGSILGVAIDSDVDKGNESVAVQSVTPNGPADKAGIKSGDLIVTLNGKTLKDDKISPPSALMQFMEGVKPGEKVKVGILRDGKKQTIEVTAEAAPFGMFALPGEPNQPQVRMLRELRTRPGTRTNAFVEGIGPEDNVIFQRFIGGEVMDMELVTVTPKLGRYFGTEHGVLVVRPPRNSAFKLEEGDVILDIDGRSPQSGVHAMRILRSYQPGEQVTFNVMRDRKTVKVTVTMPKSEFNGREPHVGMFGVPAMPGEPPLPPLPPPPPDEST